MAGVIVDVLVARDQIEPVERAFGAFGEDRVHVVADERPAEGDGMRTKIRVTADLYLESGHVESLGAFGLELVVIDYCAISGYEFGDRIGEVRIAPGTSVSFDNGGVTIGSGNDQVARMSHRRFAVGGRLDNDLNGLFDDRSLGDADA